MKTWHFKKGVQKAIEIITCVSMFTLLGICDITSKTGWLIVCILIANTFGGLYLLERFGRYGRDV